ncbi:MAG: aminotransferase class I/II-fold pyridoxal phosphate-dependent enzyme [Firmicutes bacterium]|nr:aminotransferase class I/II-fold pyridoxal phosphate-dependent enzyme [Bacillota bacterium]
MKFSDKFGRSEANILMDLDDAKNRLEKQGREVINLSIGTPDFPPDKFVMDKVSEGFLDPENYKYGMTESKELADAVINWYKRRYGVELAAENITAVNGSQEGIAHIAFPLINAGDTVLVPDPCYQIFGFGPVLADAKLEYMPLLKENDYLIDFDAIPEETAKRAKVMIVSYPNNPTTAQAPKEFYFRLVEFAKKYDIIVIHDNAYSELIFDGGEGLSFLQIPGAMDVGIEFNSLSKSYNLTGLRLSFALGNADIIKRFRAFRSQIDYGICMGIQNAAVAALNGPQDILERNRAEYKKRRDYLHDGLNRIGWKVPLGDATMFTWYPIPEKYGTDDEEFTFDLLEKAGVVCVPGSSFGRHGRGYVRMALVQPCEMLEKAIKSIDNSSILK